ncbi:hypothetical protein, partial [Psychrobacter sp. PG1]
DCYIYDYYGLVNCIFDETTLFESGVIKIPPSKKTSSQLKKTHLSKKVLLLDNTSEIIDSIDSPSHISDDRSMKSLKSLIKLFHSNGNFKPRKSVEIRKKKGGYLVDRMLSSGIIQTNRNSKLNQEEFEINPELQVILFQFLDSGVTTPEIYEIIRDL